MAGALAKPAEVLCGAPAKPAHGPTAGVPCGGPPDNPRSHRDWLQTDAQAELIRRAVERDGRSMIRRPTRQHAIRLLAWLQSHGDGGDDVVFEHIREEYLAMCLELGWWPESWIAIGRYFTPLTGGKRYRRVYDERTGRITLKERIYAIPTIRATVDSGSACEDVQQGPLFAGRAA